MHTNNHLLPHQLKVDVDGKQEWRECADITGLRLPASYYFGASSATGDLSGMNVKLLYLLSVEHVDFIFGTLKKLLVSEAESKSL